MSWNYNNSSDSDVWDSDEENGYKHQKRNYVKENKSESYVYKMQLKKYELFKSQNPEIGYFDVVFEIDGKILYVHKFDFVVNSETLNAMLSDRWTTKDKPVKNETYSFEIFYQFCCFIYSGKCQLTMKNVSKIIDASEFFGVQYLKDYCEDFLMENKKNIDESNIYEMAELVEKYDFNKFDTYIYDRLYRNFYILITDENFVNLSKPQIKCLLEIEDREDESTLFEALYKWSEDQALLKKSETIDFNLEEAIKNEFNDFKHYIKYENIESDFGMEIIVTKSFLFTPSELQNIVFIFDECKNK